MFVKVLFTLLSLLFVFPAYGAPNNTNHNQIVKFNFRQRHLTDDNILTKVPCKGAIVNNTCECPGTCMSFDTKEKACVTFKCYAWDKNLGKCKETGKKYLVAIILAAVPATGPLGIAQLYMGRYGLFLIAIGGIMLGLFSCTFGQCFLCAVCSKEDREAVNEAACAPVTTCLMSTYSVVAYITFAILIGIRHFTDGDNCPLV